MASRVAEPSALTVLRLAPRQEASVAGRRVRIQRVDLETAIVVDVETGHVSEEKISAIGPPIKRNAPSRPLLLVTVSDADWATARVRQAVMLAIDRQSPGTNVGWSQLAAQLDMSRHSLRRLHKEWLLDPQLVTLLPKKRPGGRGKSRLRAKVEELIQKALDSFHFTARKPSATATYQKCLIPLFKAEGLQQHIPHINTLRRRIAQISPERALRLREGRAAAEAKFEPAVGHLPGADYPYAVIQIDHSPEDIELVSSDDRETVGRAHLTLAIDVFSRCCTGYYMSFYPPGTLSTGITIYRSIMMKDACLAELGVDGSWPVYDVPQLVHTDNASEFSSRAMERALENLGVDSKFRQLGRPQGGGHIERFMRTVMDWIHSELGSTHSNPTKRGKLRTTPIYTLEEFERKFVHWIVHIYHNTKHRELGMTPLEKYALGRRGSGATIGTGLRRRVFDDRSLRISLLPIVQRTINRGYGVMIDGVRYWSDEAFRHWIGRPHPEGGTKFTFHCDPRNIGEIYFEDPIAKTYIAIPYLDRAKPPITAWEREDARKHLVKMGVSVTEDAIFAAHAEQLRMEEDSRRKTRAAKLTRRARRRKEQRRLIERPDGTVIPKALPPPRDAPLALPPPDPIPEFGDLEDL